MLPATSAKSTTLDVNAVKAPSASRLPITKNTDRENQGRLWLAFRAIHYRGLYEDATRFLLQIGLENAYFRMGWSLSVPLSMIGPARIQLCHPQPPVAMTSTLYCTGELRFFVICFRIYDIDI